MNKIMKFLKIMFTDKLCQYHYCGEPTEIIILSKLFTLARCKKHFNEKKYIERGKPFFILNKDLGENLES